MLNNVDAKCFLKLMRDTVTTQELIAYAVMCVPNHAVVHTVLVLMNYFVFNTLLYIISNNVS